VRRISELEYAWQSLRVPVIAVTGTNGKSTTTALIAHLLTAAGLGAEAAGNIGVALSEIALRTRQPDWVVIEASSYQLADVESFAPRVGVVTNLAPDHLDRYPNVAAYYADKARLFERATPESRWVLNGEDDEVLRLAGDAPGRRYLFHVDTRPAADADGAWIEDDGTMRARVDGRAAELGNVSELRLFGRHNHANVLAAALAALAAEVPADAIARALPAFGGLEHRFEVFAERGGVRWINDSKATNVVSARVALRSLDRPVVLLLGGQAKGECFDALLPELRAAELRGVLAFGAARPQIEAELGGAVLVEGVDGGLDRVVERAASLARRGDTVLFAPACANFDMFRDYEDRGRQFKTAVAKLAEAADA
jgi:UDP-N-acetylmuramoylalanine--D-glutamate ligase